MRRDVYPWMSSSPTAKLRIERHSWVRCQANQNFFLRILQGIVFDLFSLWIGSINSIMHIDRLVKLTLWLFIQELCCPARPGTPQPLVQRAHMLGAERCLYTALVTKRWQSCCGEMLKLFGDGSCGNCSCQVWKTLSSCAGSIWKLRYPNRIEDHQARK